MQHVLDVHRAHVVHLLQKHGVLLVQIGDVDPVRVHVLVLVDSLLDEAETRLEREGGSSVQQQREQEGEAENQPPPTKKRGGG